MSQLQAVASITHGSQAVAVTGDISAQVLRNFTFMVAGELVPYTVSANATFDGTRTNFTLTGAYAGTTNATASVVIVTGYTYPDNIPVIAQGDVGTAAVFTQAMYRIQEMVHAVAPEGVQEVIDNATQVAADRAVVAADKATVAADKAIVAADKATVATNKAATDANVTAAANQATIATAQKVLAETAATTSTAQATISTSQATVAVNASAAASGYSSNAGTKSTEATASAAAAAASATTANTKKVEAEAAAAAAAGSATTATTQATTSTTQAAASAASAADSLTSKSLAQSWAEAAEDAPVVTGQYSAKHWALKAQQAAVGGLIFRGNWSAAAGTYPTPIRSGAGDMWRVSVAGVVSSVAYDVGDAIIYDGAAGWIKQDNTEQVTSVAGRVGAVTLTKTDVGLSNVDNTTDLAKPVSTAVQTALNAKLNLTGGEVAGSLATTGGMTSVEGFYTTSYVSGRNAIWRFLNAQAYGLSYFQGAGGYGGTDSIGFHFGTPTVAGSSLHVRERGIVAKNLEVTSGADTWFQMGADTTAASYGLFRKGGTNTSVGIIGTDGGGALGGGSGEKFVVRSMLGDLMLYADNGQVVSYGALTVTGAASIGGAASVTGGLYVTGGGSFGAGLKVTGAATLGANAAKEWSYEHPVTRFYVGDGTGYSFAIAKRSGSVTTDRFTFGDNGFFGIGAHVPGYNLHVSSTDDNGIQLTKQGVLASRIKITSAGLQFGVDGVDGATVRATLDTSGLNVSGVGYFGRSDLTQIGRFNGRGAGGAYTEWYDAANNAAKGYVGYGATLFGGADSEFGIRSAGNLMFYADGVVAGKFAGTSLAVNGDGSFAGGTLTIKGEQAIKYRDFGYSSSYSALQVGSTGTHSNVALAVDPYTIAGGSFSGSSQVLVTRKGFLAPNAAGTNWIGGMAWSGDAVVIGPTLSSGITSGPLTVGTGTITSSVGFEVTHATADSGSVGFSNTHALGYGVYSRGGSGGRYAAQFNDKDGNQLMLLSGAGALTVAGGGTFGGSLSSNGRLKTGTTSDPSSAEIRHVIASSGDAGALTQWSNNAQSVGLAFGINSGGVAQWYAINGALAAESYSLLMSLERSGNLSTVGAGSFGGNVTAHLSSANNNTFRGFKFGITNDGTDFGSVSMQMNLGEVRYTAGFSGWGGYHTWHANGALRMTLNSSGNLGIGTASPDRRLVVNGDLGFSYSDTVSANGVRLTGVATEYFNNITGTPAWIIHNFTGSSGVSKFAVTEGGNVFMGATAAINLFSSTSLGITIKGNGATANFTASASNAQNTTIEVSAAHGVNLGAILVKGDSGRPALKFYQVVGGTYLESMTLDESANFLIGRTANPKGAKLAIEGDLAVHAGNTRATAKYTVVSGVGSTNTWTSVVDLSALQTGSGFFGGRIRCHGSENGSVNTSYCEYYALYSSYYGWSITPIGTKLAVGNDYGNMSLRISGTNLQVQNGAGAGGPGTCNISIDIFEPN